MTLVESRQKAERNPRYIESWGEGSLSAEYHFEPIGRVLGRDSGAKLGWDVLCVL